MSNYMREKAKNKLADSATFLSLLVFFFSSIITLNVNASPIQLIDKKLKINAEYLESKDKNKPFFLILHGTFAWHGMELINALQENLNNKKYGSLALTLSLAEDNRKQFFDCSHTILSKHEDAQKELNIWLTWLENKGYKNIHVIGHSRGGAQVAQFSINQSKRINKVFLIAPMVWDSNKTSDSFIQSNKKKLNELLKTISTQTSEQLFNINQAFHCSNTKISNEAFISYYDSKPIKNTVELFAKIKNPVYVYLGDSDRLTKDFNQQFSILKKQPHVVVKTIEDADHYFRDFATEDIVEDIISVLNL
ncbi:MAG: esterase/lipase [Polaribacter sp.]|jgi:esterase/lipase